MEQTYTIKPAIACYVMVYCNEFPKVFGEHRQDYIYRKEGVIEQPPTGKQPFGLLPHAVQETIKEHFNKVFALPVEKRQEYLIGKPPIEVTIKH